jgi:hypothetical protein
LSQEEGKIYAKVQKNESTNMERKTEIGVKNTKTSVETKVSLKQGMAGYGIVLSKSLWKIVAHSENTNTQYNDGSANKLFDNLWTPDKANEKHVEFWGRNNNDDHAAVPYILTFDLGENPRQYDSFGFMPRLQWTQQAPKTVAIEVSDDLNAGWETAFEKKTGNCFTDAELKGSTNTYNDHYEGIVHWCKLNGVVHKRYVRLYLYESFQGVGKSVSLDEVFASDRTTVE